MEHSRALGRFYSASLALDLWELLHQHFGAAGMSRVAGTRTKAGKTVGRLVQVPLGTSPGVERFSPAKSQLSEAREEWLFSLSLLWNVVGRVVGSCWLTESLPRNSSERAWDCALTSGHGDVLGFCGGRWGELMRQKEKKQNKTPIPIGFITVISLCCQLLNTSRAARGGKWDWSARFVVSWCC